MCQAGANLPEECEVEVVSFDFVIQLMKDEQRNGGKSGFMAGWHGIGPAGIRRWIVVDNLLAQFGHHSVHERINRPFACGRREELVQQSPCLEDILFAEVEEGQLQFRSGRFDLNETQHSNYALS